MPEIKVEIDCLENTCHRCHLWYCEDTVFRVRCAVFGKRIKDEQRLPECIEAQRKAEGK